MADDIDLENFDKESNADEVNSALATLAAAAVIGVGAYLLYKALKKE